MPATNRIAGVRPGARRTIVTTVTLGLLGGLGLSAPATTPVAHATPASTTSTTSTTTNAAMVTPISDAPTAEQVAAEQAAQKAAAKAAKKAEQKAKQKAKKKARQKARKKARIKAHKARVARRQAARRARNSTLGRIGRAKGIAMAQRGDAYVYGATGPNAFDCSGLVQYAYHRAGLTGMPRTSSAQAGHTRRIAKGAMRPGDLMFFANGGGVYHVGMFAGRAADGAPLMVHASRPGTPVAIARPWTSSWFAGTVR